MHLVTFRIRPHNFVATRRNETGSLCLYSRARCCRLICLVIFQNLEIAILHAKGEILVMKITHPTKSRIVRNFIPRAKHIVREVIKRTTHALRQHRSNIHIGDVNVLRTQVALEPRSFALRNRIAVCTRIHDAFKGVAITPKSTELDVI